MRKEEWRQKTSNPSGSWNKIRIIVNRPILVHEPGGWGKIKFKMATFILPRWLVLQQFYRKLILKSNPLQLGSEIRHYKLIIIKMNNIICCKYPQKENLKINSLIRIKTFVVTNRVQKLDQILELNPTIWQRLWTPHYLMA